MREMTLTITNKVGLHARPASILVQTCNTFQSAITLQNMTRQTRPVDAKSILGVLTLGAEQGHTIAVRADGPDEGEVLARVRALVQGRFGEAE